ncbi:MAG: glutamate dehydrogenase (NADP+) [Arcticibacterium sp.]|jgi:glutamate dehydrogenase (NADP+)
MLALTNTHEEIIKSFLDGVKERNPGEHEFYQAVQEFAEIIIPFIEAHPEYQGNALMKRLTEPDRLISFRVTWLDDDEKIQVNKGYRVQFNNAIGPYKGGLRFHPSVNLSILKFLAFEQVFKNSLTTLPLGGGKGGSDFDPKGKSDTEIMRYCHAFMLEFYRYIGEDTDVPAGDIGVGSREVGYLFGMYKKLKNEHTGSFTGKGLAFGGSLIRPEATGYGCVYFANKMLQHDRGESIQGKRCLVSGSGSVAQYTIEKILEMGGSVHSISDSNGTVYDKNGITPEKLAWIKELKNVKRGRIEAYAEAFDLVFLENKKPWGLKCDLAFPSATQNEINKSDAENLVKNGCYLVAEGANMPTTIEGVVVFQKMRILYAPGKASNAGGVATSGLEMTQNSLRLSWTLEEVDKKLHDIMLNIHEQCLKYGKTPSGYIDYVKGANIAGFIKVADAVIAEGVL